LAPEERLAEILYSLILVLVVTSVTEMALADGPQRSLAIVAAALGTTVAWGLVDGMMYVFTNLAERGRNAKLLTEVRSTRDRSESTAIVAREIGSGPLQFLGEAERGHIASGIVEAAHRLTPPKVRITRNEIAGAFVIFLLVFGAGMPVLIPFLLLPRLELAWVASRAIGIVMLFLVGHEWAKFAGRSPLRSGFALVVMGSSVTAVTAALGG
jgi:VIT1/CCC1 family predicted Fe2+/Mn2+ transporter